MPVFLGLYQYPNWDVMISIDHYSEHFLVSNNLFFLNLSHYSLNFQSAKRSFDFNTFLIESILVAFDNSVIWEHFAL